ncbi:MAG: helix-turn-helix domain-containing protein [Actinomycetota bacterium]
MSATHPVDEPIPLDQRPTWTLDETARVIGGGVSRTWVTRHVPTVKLGGRRFVRRDDFQAWLDAQAEAS